MKKLLFLSLTFISLLSTAQFTLQNEETGNAIVDGSIVTVTQDHLLTHVTLSNTSNVSIKATLEVMSINNTDGTEMGQLCFGFHGQGQCNVGVTVGNVYNSNINTDSHGNYNYLQPGESSGTGDIDFLHADNNNNQGFTNYPKDYVFKITAYNSSTGAQVGTPLTFTYRYNPTGSIDTFNNSPFQAFVNAQKELVVNTENALSFTMFTLTGQQVLEAKLSSGTHHLNVAKLPAGIYLMYAKINNKRVYKKIVIQ